MNLVALFVGFYRLIMGWLWSYSCTQAFVPLTVIAAILSLNVKILGKLIQWNLYRYPSIKYGNKILMNDLYFGETHLYVHIQKFDVLCYFGRFAHTPANYLRLRGNNSLRFGTQGVTVLAARLNTFYLHNLLEIFITARKRRSYLLSHGPWWLLRNIYIKPQSIPSPAECLLCNNHRGPSVNKYDLSVSWKF